MRWNRARQAGRPQQPSRRARRIPPPGHSLRTSPASPKSRLFLDRNPHARVRHRRDHRDFFRSLRTAVAPLPYPGSDRLMFIYKHTKHDDMSGLLNQNFFAAQSAPRSFESVAGYIDYGDENLTSAGVPIRVSAVEVTANFFPTLRVLPALGRNFSSSEDRKGSPVVVILSHRLWQSRLNSDPGVIGRTITLAGKRKPWWEFCPRTLSFPIPQPSPISMSLPVWIPIPVLKRLPSRSGQCRLAESGSQFGARLSGHQRSGGRRSSDRVHQLPEHAAISALR